MTGKKHHVRRGTGIPFRVEELERRQLLSTGTPSFSLSVSVTPTAFSYDGQQGMAKVTIRNTGHVGSTFDSLHIDLATDSAAENVVSEAGVRLLRNLPHPGQSTTVRLPLTIRILDQPDGPYYLLARLWGQVETPLAQSPVIPITLTRVSALLSATLQTAPSYTAGKKGPITVFIHNDGDQPVSTVVGVDLAFSTVPVPDSMHSQDQILDVDQLVSLRPHASRTFRLKVPVPADPPFAATSPAQFFWIAKVVQNALTPDESTIQITSPALSVKGISMWPFSLPTILWMPSTNYGGAGLSAIAAADFNGDGNQDLLVLDKGGFVLVLSGNGDGTFKPPTPIPVTNPDGSAAAPTAVAVADLNGDSKPDLVVGLGYVGVQVLYGNGDGTFRAGPITTAGYDVIGLALADFNGDKTPDVLLADDNVDLSAAPPGAVRLLLGNGNGTFSTPKGVSADAVPSAVVAADFNGDGNPDFAYTGLFDGGVFIQLGDGHGGFSAPVRYDPGGAAQSLAVADFNGDGVPDLAVGNVTENAAALINNGHGQFTLSGPYTVSAAAQGVVVGDFNDDGFADFATFGQLIDNVNLLLGDGKGNFRDGGLLHPGGNWAAYPTGGVVGDFNHDTRPDLAFIIIQAGIAGLLGSQQPSV